MYFRDRIEAGQVLARHLESYKTRSDVLVLGLPRGGVPVAYEVARELNAPLDVFIVRKLGVPGHEELGMGAIATGGIRIVHFTANRPGKYELACAELCGQFHYRMKSFMLVLPADEHQALMALPQDQR